LTPQANRRSFPQKLDVQEQLDDFKKEVNSKLDQILCQTVQTAKKFTFQPTFTANSYKIATTNPKQPNQSYHNPKTKILCCYTRRESRNIHMDNCSKYQVKTHCYTKNTTSYRDRHLIITSTTVVKTLDSISIRNNINNALKSANLNIMVATVTMSQSKSNIVITILPEITAEDLLKHQKIWQHVLDFTKVKRMKNGTK
jgi:hypothetical protein